MTENNAGFHPFQFLYFENNGNQTQLKNHDNLNLLHMVVFETQKKRMQANSKTPNSHFSMRSRRRGDPHILPSSILSTQLFFLATKSAQTTRKVRGSENKKEKRKKNSCFSNTT